MTIRAKKKVSTCLVAAVWTVFCHCCLCWNISEKHTHEEKCKALLGAFSSYVTHVHDSAFSFYIHHITSVRHGCERVSPEKFACQGGIVQRTKHGVTQPSVTH